MSIRVLAFIALTVTGMVGVTVSHRAVADSANAQGTCPTYNVDYINDICWRCMLPITLGGMPLANVDGQRDTENPGAIFCCCECGTQYERDGIAFGFWEPAVMMEVVRTPYCFPSLGGQIMSVSASDIPPPRHGRRTRTTRGEAPDVWYQAHQYAFPILWLLGVANDNPCIMQNAWDLVWITEIDPTWNKPKMAQTFNFEASLFGSPIAIAACAVDCVAATFNFGIQALFWCAGCQGGMYPQQGWIEHHNGLVDSSLLTTQRMMYKSHKLGISLAYHGELALEACSGVYEYPMDHRQYKTQMLGPVPMSTPIFGQCCLPFGASSITWRANREYPLKGEDALYLLFRKRNCCFTS